MRSRCLNSFLTIKKKTNSPSSAKYIYFYRRNAFSNEMTAKITKDNISYGILTISIVLQYSAISQTNRRKKDDFWLNNFQLISHPLSWITTWNLSNWIKKNINQIWQSSNQREQQVTMVILKNQFINSTYFFYIIIKILHGARSCACICVFVCCKRNGTSIYEFIHGFTPKPHWIFDFCKDISFYFVFFSCCIHFTIISVIRIKSQLRREHKTNIDVERNFLANHTD